MSRITRKCGIYKITCIVNNKIYIGKSISIFDRWDKHVASLNKNNHENLYLQRSWNKYGKHNFKFEILEECTEEELIIKEYDWISNTNCLDKSKGYNIVEQYSAPQNSKSYIITFPNGEEIMIHNLQKFCKDNRLDYSKMQNVASGKAKYHNGYICRKENMTQQAWLNSFRKKSNNIKVGWEIVDPEGNLYVMKNINIFCKERGLYSTSMYRIARCLQKTHKGYICRKLEESNG